MHDGPACTEFARRRGDPADMLSRTYGDIKGMAFQLNVVATNGRQPPPERRIADMSTHLWRPRQQALQALPPDSNGISFPSPDRQQRREVMRFLAITAATEALADLKIGCERCGSWFEIRRLQRMPRFCSSTCQLLHFHTLAADQDDRPRATTCSR